MQALACQRVRVCICASHLLLQTQVQLPPPPAHTTTSIASRALVLPSPAPQHFFLSRYKALKGLHPHAKDAELLRMSRADFGALPQEEQQKWADEVRAVAAGASGGCLLWRAIWRSSEGHQQGPLLMLHMHHQRQSRACRRPA